MKQQTQTNKIEWREVELGEIFIFKEKTGIKAGEGLEKGKYKFFTSSDTQSKFLDRFNFKEEHLIFSTGGKAGLHYCNEPFSVSNDCFTVQVKGHSTKLIFYLLKSKIYLLERGFKGAGLKHLSKDYLNKIKIPLPFSNGKPNLKEQERIVSILEKAENLKEKGRKAEELFEEYLKSVFNEMFYNKGFKEVKLWAITENLDSKRIPISQEERAKIQGDIPYYGACDIVDYVNKFIFNEEILLVGEDGQNLVSRNKPMAFIVSGKSWVNNHAHVLKIREKVNINYLKYYLNSIDYSEYITGSAQPKLNQSKLSNISLPLPPLPLQQKFAKIVEQVEKMKENVKKTKQSSEELFNSLMSKAFKGEL